MEIGYRIKKARAAAGMSQTELAAAIGVSRGLVGSWESHIKNPGRETLKRAAQALCVDINELLSDGPMTAPSLLVTAPEEIDMLRAFRRMSVRQRENLVELLRVSVDVRREMKQKRHPAKS